MNEDNNDSDEQVLFSAASHPQENSEDTDMFEDAQESIYNELQVELNGDDPGNSVVIDVPVEQAEFIEPCHNETAEDSLDVPHEGSSSRRFDETIPMTHPYLGDDMTDVYGRVVIQEDDIVKLPLYCDPSIILVPNQIVPLQLFHPRLVAMVRFISERQKIFIFVSEKIKRLGINEMIGTTAELMSVNTQNEEAESSIKLLVVGRQRVKIQDLTHQTDGMLMATAKLLKDVELGDALWPILPHKLRPNVQAHSSSSGRRKIRHDDGSIVTSWPSFMIHRFTKANFMNTIKGRLEGIWGETYNAGLSMNDPNRFSYWLTTNLPLADHEKIHLLSIPSDMERLYHISHLLNMNYRYIICDLCTEVIAKVEDMFSMSVAGPSGAYVNPHGCVHELITVHKTQAVSMAGLPSTEYSWFPGYAWTIINCSNCISHIGWKFTAVESGLIPSEFYGLSRRSVFASTNRQNRRNDRGNFPDILSEESEDDNEELVIFL